MSNDTPPSNPAQVFAVFTEISIISQLSNALLAASLPDGLHPSHFAIVQHLARAGTGKTPVAIARAMQVTKNTMTHSIKVLEGRGLIEVRANPADGRGKLVFLTPEGGAFLGEAIAGVARKFGPLMTDEIREALLRMAPDLARVRAHLDANRP